MIYNQILKQYTYINERERDVTIPELSTVAINGIMKQGSYTVLSTATVTVGYINKVINTVHNDI